LRFEAGEGEFAACSLLALVDVDVRRSATRLEIWVEPGTFPRAFFDALVRGMRRELERRARGGQVIHPLRVTLEQAVVHPIDARERGHEDAGVRAIARVVEGDSS
jgi:hypothetical protein